MSEVYVTVYRSLDVFEAEIVLDLLEQGGIAARHLGTRNAAAIGVGAHVLEQRVEVPAEDEAPARALLALLHADAVAETTGAHEAATLPEASHLPEVPNPQPPPTPAGYARPPRSRVVALGATLAIPGGGHFYTRQPTGGWCIVLAMLAALGTLTQATDARVQLAAICVLCVAWLSDVVGGQLAVRVRSTAAKPRWRQVVVLGVMLIASVPVVLLLASHQAVQPTSPPAPAYPEILLAPPTPESRLGPHELPLPVLALDPRPLVGGLPRATPQPVPVRVQAAHIEQPTTTPDAIIGDGHCAAREGILALDARSDGSVLAVTAEGWTLFAADGTPQHHVRALGRLDSPIQVVGTRLVATTYGSVGVHDVASGDELRVDREQLPHRPVTAALAADGVRLAFAGHGGVFLVDRGGATLSRWDTADATVRTLAVGPAELVTMLTDKDVRLLRPDGTQTVLHPQPCEGALVAPAPVDVVLLRQCAGRIVAYDATGARLWDAAEVGYSVTGTYDVVTGHCAVIAGDEVRYYACRTGAVFAAAKHGATGHVEALASSASGLVVSRGHVFSVVTPGADVPASALTRPPDIVRGNAKIVAIGTWAGPLALVLADGSPLRVVGDVKLDELLVTDHGTVVVRPRDGEPVRVFAVSGEELASLDPWYHLVRAVPGGRILVEKDAIIRILDPTSGEEQVLSQRPRYAEDLVASGDGRWLALANADGLSLWNTKSGEATFEPYSPAAGEPAAVPDPIRSRLVPDLTTAPTGFHLRYADGRVETWEQRDAAWQHSGAPPHVQESFSDLSSDGRYAARSVSGGERIDVIDTASGERLRSIALGERLGVDHTEMLGDGVLAVILRDTRVLLYQSMQRQ